MIFNSYLPFNIFLYISLLFTHTHSCTILLFMYHAYHTCVFLSCCLFGLKSRRVSSQQALDARLHSLDLLLLSPMFFLECNYFTPVLWFVCHVCLCHVCIYMFVFWQDSQSKQGGYSMHQLQGNKEFGSEKKGYLLKKSDGWENLKYLYTLCSTGNMLIFYQINRNLLAF